MRQASLLLFRACRKRKKRQTVHTVTVMPLGKWGRAVFLLPKQANERLRFLPKLSTNLLRRVGERCKESALCPGEARPSKPEMPVDRLSMQQPVAKEKTNPRTVLNHSFLPAVLRSAPRKSRPDFDAANPTLERAYCSGLKPAPGCGSGYRNCEQESLLLSATGLCSPNTASISTLKLSHSAFTFLWNPAQTALSDRLGWPSS